MKKEDTAVLQFIGIAWQYAGGNPHSWERFNQEVREVCHIAAASFPWKPLDIDKIKEIGNWKSSVGRCLGESGWEGMYTVAVSYSNVSAWTEIERFFKRTPIMADNVDSRKRSRICVGSSFPWKGEKVRVTSFNKDGLAVCCSYKPHEFDANGYIIGPEKILHRFTISAEDVKSERKILRQTTEHKEREQL